MDFRGYAGQILYVDLDSGAATKGPLDIDMARAFIGGFGVNHKLAYDLIKPGVGALSPENVIVVGAGVLSGTMAPGSSRISATTKFPQTGAIASGNGGLKFAAELKAAGYDHLVITGKADRPGYLNIVDDKVEICDAGNLWGQDLCDTTDALWQKHGGNSSVIAIGQAGENLVGVSLTLVDRSATLGKGGLAAVMGSKNLKALVVRGTGGVAVADHLRVLKLVDRHMERVRKYPLRPEWIDKGINFTMTKADWENPRIGMEIYLNKVKQGRMCCPSCTMADKEVLGVSEGEHQGMLVYTAGWSGRSRNFSACCPDSSYDKVMKCLDAANRYGIDSHSFSSIFVHAVRLYEQGVITDADTEGLVLKRDFDTTMALLHQTAHRQGLGDTLADGMVGMNRRFGPEAEIEANFVKGLETSQDARVTGLGTMEFELALNPRGGHHSAGGSPSYAGAGASVDKFASHCARMGAPPDAVKRILDSPFGFNVGRLSRYAEDWYATLSSLGLCNRAQINRFHSIDSCAELYSATTGFEISPEELETAAERVWNVKKASNVREGFDRKDDRLPPSWFQPLKDAEGRELRIRDYYGTKDLTPEDVEYLFDDYYDERGWTRATSIPSREKLEELGLGDIARDLGLTATGPAPRTR